jgi:uncharacterized membrane protein
MSDRLDALLRQRALLREHVAWLDSEIAAAQAAEERAPADSSPTPFASAAAPTPRVESPAARPPAAPAVAPRPAPPPPAAPTLVAAQADEILETYRTPANSLQSDVRKGCFLYFFAALALVGLGVTALYFLIGTRR